MCGIFGIISDTNVVAPLVSGLAHLEYRGYDSAGIEVIDAGRVTVRRAEGKLEGLRRLIEDEPFAGTIGIGHTRWATHGAPSTRNAHPHRAGAVTHVHNGIIENHAELRRRLTAEGCIFTSDADTEVIAHLLDTELRRGPSPLQAMLRTTRQLTGAYAVAALIDDQPNLIMIARHGSPLAVGYGNEGADGIFDVYIGSDAIALAPHATRICYLEDGDVGISSRLGTLFYDREGRDVDRQVAALYGAASSTDRGDFSHYTLKEIHEQAQVIDRLLDTWNKAGEGHPFTRVSRTIDLQSVDRVILVACGTSYYAEMAAKYWLEAWGGVIVETDIASEYRYPNPVFTGRELALFISQSGETADTLAALRHLNGKVAGRVAIVNVASSSMAREADATLDIEAGLKIGVASTKAFTAQLFNLAAFALH